jgi:hypothetical protein
MCAFIPAAACSGIITGACLRAVLAFLLLLVLVLSQASLKFLMFSLLLASLLLLASPYYY